MMNPKSEDPGRKHSGPTLPNTSEPVAHGSREGSARSFFPDLNLVTRALEYANIGVWACDVSSDKITCSRNFEELHRLPPESHGGTFSALEKNVHPDDYPMVAAAIRESLANRRLLSVTYRLPPRPGLEERWVAATGNVVATAETSFQLVGVCTDVTARMRTERELRERAQSQELVAQLGARALIEEDLQKLLDDLTSIVATMLDADLVNVLELISGDGGLLFRSGHGWKPGIVQAAHIPISVGSQASYVLAAAGPVVVTDLRSETRFTPSPLLVDHEVVSCMSTRIVGHDSRKYGMFSVHTRRQRNFGEYEVALLTSIANVIAGAIQRRQLSQRQDMMIRELHHRSGNLFSQLLALFSQTASNSKSLSELVSKYEARVFALANAHRILVERGWQPASLLELLGAQLAPCLDRISLNGPDVYLEPASAFALSTAAHELVSNAIKHGSLSALTGRVDVNWSVDRTAQGVTLELDWLERDGPPPKRTSRLKFGSRLINTVIEHQMNGEVRRAFLPEGLRCRLVMPLTHERWPEGGSLNESSLDVG